MKWGKLIQAHKMTSSPDRSAVYMQCSGVYTLGQRRANPQNWLNPDLNPNPDLDLPAFALGKMQGYTALGLGM